MSESSPPQDWLDALDRADADVAAGMVVDATVIHADLQASIDQMMCGKDLGVFYDQADIPGRL